jgi:hypothetical protein
MFLYFIKHQNNKHLGVNRMAKIKGTNKRSRPKSNYKKPGSKRGRGTKRR